MIIAIPTENSTMKNTVSPVFGRSPFFLIYNTDTAEAKFINNTAINSQGGAGVKAAQLIIDNDVDSLIIPRCGKNAADLLNLSDIVIYKSLDESIEKNINAYTVKKLFPLTNIHEGFHNHGQD